MSFKSYCIILVFVLAYSPFYAQSMLEPNEDEALITFKIYNPNTQNPWVKMKLSVTGDLLGQPIDLETNEEGKVEVLLPTGSSYTLNFVDRPNFGNIDVDWVLSFQFKINKLFQANFRSHLIYDDDIKIKKTNDNGDVETLGARVQLKQQLGIGIVYSF